MAMRLAKHLNALKPLFLKVKNATGLKHSSAGLQTNIHAGCRAVLLA
jgi:hypothetical protein